MRKILPLFGTITMGVAVATAGVMFVETSVQEVTPSTETVQTTQSDTSDATQNETANTDQASGGNIVEDVVNSVARFFGIGTDSENSESQIAIAPSISSQIAQISESDTPDYRQLKLRGINLAGLEFSGLFQSNTEQTYKYFRQKGFNLVRLPVEWDELQPYLYGDFDSTAKQYIDQNIAWAKQNDLAVILDVHNYGRRQVYRDGGLVDDFADQTQHTFKMPYGDHDSKEGTITFRDYGRGSAGTIANPVSANGYKTTFDAKIDTASGDLWNEFFMDVYYQDDDNRYSLAINPISNTWNLRQTVGGKQSILASGSKTWTVGQYYNFEIDVNQTAVGKINVTVDGESLFATNSVNTTSELKNGYVSMFPAGVKATIKDFTLDVDGDTTSGGAIEQRIADEDLPIEAWQDLWTRLAKAYKDEPAVFGYDHNEPHDMPVPTTQNNYSYAAAKANGVPVATATQTAQTMVNAIRAAGDTKFVMVEMDHWANTHYFNTQYGANATPWITDTLSPQKIVYSGHYYFDSDHSGMYGDGMVKTNESVDLDVSPFFDWCTNQKTLCYVGEFGVPNTAEWQPVLKHFLQQMQDHNIWWTQWAGGDLYSSVTSLQPTSSFTLDTLQMETIAPFLNQ